MNVQQIAGMVRNVVRVQVDAEMMRAAMNAGEMPDESNAWAAAAAVVEVVNDQLVDAGVLVHLTRVVAMMVADTECEAPGHGPGDDCDACAWRVLYASVPAPVRALADQRPADPS